MKKCLRHIKFKSVLFFLLFLGLFCTNAFWYKMYHKEKNNLKNSLIPILSEDYYSKQLALTQVFKNNIQYTPEYIYYSDKEDPFFQIDNVPLVLQNPEYPNGCEAAAAVMVLQYFGVDITLKNFIDNYLMKDKVYAKDGNLFGPDPSVYYAGDPTEIKGGWGVFEPAIKSAVAKVLTNEKRENSYQVMGSDAKYPLAMYIHAAPFMIWTTSDYNEVEEIYKWYSYDGKKTFTYPKNSHAVVVTGLDEQYYYINDPLKPEKNIPVEKARLEKSFDSLGRQIVQLY